MTTPTPLVLLHGFLGDARDFDPLVEHLAHRPCLALDLPGHGIASAAVAPGGPFDAGVDRVREDIARRIGNAPRYHLVGYSMGGRIALCLALAHPDRVASVVAIGASTGLADRGERARRRAADEELARRLETEPFAAFLQWWYGQELFASLRTRPEFPALLARRAQGQPRALAAALRTFSVGGQPPLLPALAHGGHPPILLIAGDRDPRYAEHNARVAAACAGVTSRVIPGAGHAVHLERSAELARIITDPFGPEQQQQQQQQE